MGEILVCHVCGSSKFVDPTDGIFTFTPHKGVYLTYLYRSVLRRPKSPLNAFFTHCVFCGCRYTYWYFDVDDDVFNKFSKLVSLEDTLCSTPNNEALRDVLRKKLKLVLDAICEGKVIEHLDVLMKFIDNVIDECIYSDVVEYTKLIKTKLILLL